MKKSLNRVLTLALSAIFCGALLITAGCGKKLQQRLHPQNSLFAYVPYDCQAIGAINVASIVKIKSIAKQIEKNKNVPYYNQIKPAGLDLNNIDSIVFGVELKPIPQTATTADLTEPDGVIIVNAKSTISVAKFLKAAQNEDKTITYQTITIDGKTVFVLPATKYESETYIAQLNDKQVAAGSKKDITETIALLNHKGKSVLDNEEMMTLTSNTDLKDMAWFAAIIPDNFISKTDKNNPVIKDTMLSANYVKDTLHIDGTIRCATKEDTQKILIPFQLAASLIALNSNNTVLPEDLAIQANNNVLTVKIKLSKDALETLLARNVPPTTATTVDTATSDSVLVTTQQVPPVAAPAKTAPAVSAPAPVTTPAAPKAPVVNPASVAPSAPVVKPVPALPAIPTTVAKPVPVVPAPVVNAKTIADTAAGK